MLSLSASQFRKALVYLSLLHILIIAASNYLVQFPFEFLGLHNTWGAFTFPFIFLATDLTVRVFGKVLARRIVFAVMFPALLLSYVISVVFAEGRFAGFSGLGDFNLFVARIALASFMAYMLGQLLDIKVFDRLRRVPLWWVAPAASTLLGNALDTLVFFGVAFQNSPDAFMAAHWPEIALVDYGFKLGLSLLFFLPAYGLVLAWLQQRLLLESPKGAVKL
ncbi:7-cyano-7-deazaguanine/7-aminomethyl-7-deazaguanine transporter [Marinospirillum sp.]|uniref:7-cyano-7-deazaguanine/7-aminomethyl-7- deazaguanine transporter n=1 Tax=Marinospirillum sp. TaxID=2183934 RepID=UPI00286FD710|nr:7-cyano-7-deazaguanine/7-aminomethyl-7-deazaguanine transporter [Marinospirillum sp.]MDR9467787.1 7-cyano-7-deazaguanine/7-aminomethyl-7-deazaguanine transporter [Marinospirillum sp.]